jgi:hypothetical protein
MYSLSFLILELESARTALLNVFEVSNGTPIRVDCQEPVRKKSNNVFSRIDEYEKGIAH